MKLQPCRPEFFDARDAIILADLILTRGENYCDLWAGFRSRGLVSVLFIVIYHWILMGVNRRARTLRSADVHRGEVELARTGSSFRPSASRNSSEAEGPAWVAISQRPLEDLDAISTFPPPFVSNV
jgi:hypothetical protein